MQLKKVGFSGRRNCNRPRLSRNSKESTALYQDLEAKCEVYSNKSALHYPSFPKDVTYVCKNTSRQLFLTVIAFHAFTLIFIFKAPRLVLALRGVNVKGRRTYALCMEVLQRANVSQEAKITLVAFRWKLRTNTVDTKCSLWPGYSTSQHGHVIKISQILNLGKDYKTICFQRIFSGDWQPSQDKRGWKGSNPRDDEFLER